MWFGLIKMSRYNFIPLYSYLKFSIINLQKFHLLFFFFKNYYYRLIFTPYNIIILNHFLLVKQLSNTTNLWVYLKFLFNKIIYLSMKFLFLKFKFDGKGYYLYKNKKNTLGMQFNYSHKLNIYLNNISVINFSKRSWMLFGLNCNKLNNLSRYIKSFRNQNIFTLRGIRFTKQIILFKQKKKN